MTSCPAALTASKSRLRVKSWLQGEGLGLGLMVKGMYFVCEGPHNYTSIKTCFCVCVVGCLNVPFYSSALKFSAKSYHFSAAPTHTDTHQHTPTHTNTHRHTQTHAHRCCDRTHSSGRSKDAHMWADARTKTHPSCSKKVHTEIHNRKCVCVCVCVCVSNKQAYK